MGRGVYRNYYKGHMDQIKGEGGGGGGRGVRLGWGGGMGKKGIQLQLNNNKKNFFKEIALCNHPSQEMRCWISTPYWICHLLIYSPIQ